MIVRKEVNLKVAMIGQKQVPSRQGGVEVAVEELAVRMAELGHDVTLYNYRKRKCDVEMSSGTTMKKNWDYKGVHIHEIQVFDVKCAAMITSLFNTIYAVFGKFNSFIYES